MKNNKEELENIKEITNIRDFKKVNVEDVAKIDKMASEGDLSVEQMALIAEVIPNFIEHQKNVIQTLQHLLLTAGDVQKEALYAVTKSLDLSNRTIESLASATETEEGRRELARHAVEIGRIGLEVAKIIERMNKDNNELWKHLTTALVVVGLAGTAFVIYKIFSQSGDSI